jgi:hypothetical protein
MQAPSCPGTPALVLPERALPEPVHASKNGIYDHHEADEVVADSVGADMAGLKGILSAWCPLPGHQVAVQLEVHR